MQRILLFLLIFLAVPFMCVADTYIEFESFTLPLYDEWGFKEYTDQYKDSLGCDHVFFNNQQDCIVISSYPNVRPSQYENNAALFVITNTIMKETISSDGSSIVTLGEIDGYPRLTIVDETDESSSTQWFIFTDECISYIGIISPDKYRLRSYNTNLQNLQIN